MNKSSKVTIGPDHPLYEGLAAAMAEAARGDGIVLSLAELDAWAMTGELPGVARTVYGEGKHSHEVPAELGRVVLMRDSGHEGTEVYRVERGFRFVSLDRGEVNGAERCVLVRLVGVDVQALEEPYACDLDSPDGLALVGLSAEDTTDGLGEVLWDSHAPPREPRP